jgi:hypothetical protein
MAERTPRDGSFRDVPGLWIQSTNNGVVGLELAALRAHRRQGQIVEGSVMKLVGGPDDGMEVWLEPGRRTYRAVERMMPSGIAFDPTQILLNAPVQVKYTNYTVRQFLYGHPPSAAHPADRVTGKPEIEIFEFLAPEDWSDLQAIKHQFTK